VFQLQWQREKERLSAMEQLVLMTREELIQSSKNQGFLKILLIFFGLAVCILSILCKRYNSQSRQLEKQLQKLKEEKEKAGKEVLHVDGKSEPILGDMGSQKSPCKAAATDGGSLLEQIQEEIRRRSERREKESINNPNPSSESKMDSLFQKLKKMLR